MVSISGVAVGEDADDAHQVATAGLKPLTARSRDNLPNPNMDDDNIYVPKNMPAAGDLFDMIDFDHGG